MKRQIGYNVSFFAFLLFVLSLTSCKGEETVQTEKESIDIRIAMNTDSSTRSIEEYNTEIYKGMYFVYEKQNLNFSYFFSGELNSVLKLNNLDPSKSYKVVLIAVPIGQNYPVSSNAINVSSSTEVEPDYSEANTQFQEIDGDSEIGHEIFRDIITINPTIENTTYNAVLTRQNGAIEIRIRNMNISKAVLNVCGTKYMYFNDGTGGQVLSEGVINLFCTKEGEQLDNYESKIRINLLPQDDITNYSADGNTSSVNAQGVNTGNNTLTIVSGDPGTETVYKLKSSNGKIPVYPNQVTWLTLDGDGSSGDGTFEVSFSGNIHLEDDDWDGWQDY